MSLLRRNQSYSVFVGKLPPNTKEVEIGDLFKGCGEVVDVVILENSKNILRYGFVRFSEASAVIRAVSELNGWTVNGSKIMVDISKQTAEKMRLEKSGESIDGGCRRRTRVNVMSMPGGQSVGADMITDTMYRTRLQESCTAINLAHGHCNPLSMIHISEDINKLNGDRCPALWGSVDNAAIGFSEISHKIMQRCQSKGEEGEILGQKRAAEFMSALQTILKEIDTVLELNSTNSEAGMKPENLTKCKQLKLEEDLLREVNEELNTDIEHGHECAKLVPNEDEKSRNIEAKTAMKRCDASVQTVNETEDCRSLAYLTDTEYSHCNAVSDVTARDSVAVQSDNARVGPSDESETDMSYVDPAIIDYHLSKLKELEMNAGKKQHSDAEQPNIIKMLYSQMNVGEGAAETDLVRSNSRDSSLSDGFNEGNIDDSGVESDCFGVVVGRRSLGQVESMLGVQGDCRDHDGMHLSAGNRRSFLQGSKSEPNLGKFDLEQYVRKSRGRGLMSVDVTSQTAPKEDHSKHTGSSTLQGRTNSAGIGRVMFGGLGTLKMPIGRGSRM